MQKQFLALGIIGVLVLAACGRRDAPPPAPATDIAALQSPTLPADLPLQNVPVPPGGVRFAVTGDERAGRATGQSDGTVAEIAGFYAMELPAGGWFLVSSASRATGRRLEFREGSRPGARFLEIDLAPREEPSAGCAIQLAWGPAGNEEPDLESYEPEPEEPSDVDGGSFEW